MEKTILSTADVARLFNVTETTVKRWADEGTLRCQKTPGGHRKFEIRNVVEFAEKNNFDPSGALGLVRGEQVDPAVQVAVLSREYTVLVKEYVRRALSPDRTDLHAFLLYLYEHRIPLWEIYDHVLRPAMYEIGEMWARRDIGINHEHRASYETLDALAKLQTQILIKPASGNAVLLACLGDELHEIGLRCAGYLFEAEGWRMHYLGARTPHEAVKASVLETRPQVVCVSITQPGETDRQSQELREIANAAKTAGALLVAGGQGASQGLLEAGVVDEIHSSAAETIEFITRFMKNGAPQRTPEARTNGVKTRH